MMLAVRLFKLTNESLQGWVISVAQVITSKVPVDGQSLPLLPVDENVRGCKIHAHAPHVTFINSSIVIDRSEAKIASASTNS